MGEEAEAITLIHLRIRNASENSRVHATLWRPLEIHCDFFLNHSGLSLAIFREAEVTALAGVKFKKKKHFCEQAVEGTLFKFKVGRV